jgi:hypothetical protein
MGQEEPNDDRMQYAPGLGRASMTVIRKPTDSDQPRDATFPRRCTAIRVSVGIPAPLC